MRGYFRVPNAIFDKAQGLSSSDKLVYVYLRRITNNKNEGWSSYATIAEKCCITRRTAIRSVKNLVNDGVITVARNGKANHYMMVLKSH